MALNSIPWKINYIPVSCHQANGLYLVIAVAATATFFHHIITVKEEKETAVSSMNKVEERNFNSKIYLNINFVYF